MTLKNKLVLCILFIIMLFVMFNSDVIAKEHVYDYSYYDSCVNDGTCILLCAYQNDFNGKSNSQSSYIYYKFNNDKPWMIQYYFDSADRGPNSYSSSTLSDISKKIFYVVPIFQNLFMYGTCPSQSYVDNSYMGGWDYEVCFDNNGSYCVDSNPGGIGTTFEGTSILKYNHMDEFQKYYETHAPYLDFTCDFDKLTASNSEKLKEEYYNEIITKLNTDIQTNYFHGNDVPSFITASSIYQGFVSGYQNDINTKLSDCISQIQSDDSLTEEEKNTAIDSVESIGEGITSGISDSVATIVDKDDSSSDSGVEIVDDCEGLLGNGEFYNWLQDAFDLIKLAGPILVLVLGMMDFIKALASGEDDAKKKATSTFGKRLIAAILLFLIPAILSFVLSLVDTLGGGTCGIS